MIEWIALVLLVGVVIVVRDGIRATRPPLRPSVELTIIVQRP